MSSDKLIKELRIESSLLISRLQSIIDKQGTLLSGEQLANSSDNLPRVRRQLWRTMQKLAIINEELTDIYARETNNRERQLTQIREISEHETQIRVRLQQIEKNNESAEKLNVLQVRETELEDEKHQLKKRLQEVEKELIKIKKDKNELDSVVSSMKSSYLMELEECAIKKKKILKHNPIKQHDTLKENVEAQTEVLLFEMEAYKEDYNKTQREQKALEDGYLVWKSGCDSLKNLEVSIKRILGTSDSSMKKKITTDIETCLKKAIDHLEELLELSRSNEWSLLIVALSQELEALYQSKNLLESNFDQHIFQSNINDTSIDSNLSSNQPPSNKTVKVPVNSNQNHDIEDNNFFVNENID